MPSLELKTNVPLSDPKLFLLEFSEFAAKTLKKPEVYISVSYSYNENLTFNGSFDPAFLMTVTSLDNLQPALNEAYSKAFFTFFESKLGTQTDRGYITFFDPGRANMGHKGTTFTTLFSK